MIIELESCGLNRKDKVIKIANINPIVAYETEKIKDVVKKIILSKHRRIPIVDKKNRLVGIVTTMDILDAFLRRQNFNETISSIMIREIIFCEDNASIEYALQKLKVSRRGGIPIIDKNKKLLGVITERDIVKQFLNVNFNQTIEQVMTKKPFVVSNKISIYDCLKSLVNSHYRRLPVVDGKNLIGIVTSADLINYISSHEYRFEDLNAPIDFIINKNPVTISKNKDVSEAIKIMIERDVGGILVIDKDNLVGIITERDILEKIS